MYGINRADYVGKEALEKMKNQIKNGKPYKLQLVGLELGGKPIEDYANDFYLISNISGGKPVGYITSPWYHPEKGTNIAMGYVHFEGNLNSTDFLLETLVKNIKFIYQKNTQTSLLMQWLFQFLLNLLILTQEK